MMEICELVDLDLQTNWLISKNMEYFAIRRNNNDVGHEEVLNPSRNALSYCSWSDLSDMVCLDWVPILWCTNPTNFFCQKMVLRWLLGYFMDITNLSNQWLTTGLCLFAVCQGHTAKTALHSAKCLPSVTHGKQLTANNGRQRVSLPCATSRAHGKYFAVCNIRPTAK